MIIQISAGQGPSECQLAVAKLFEALQKEYGDLVEISKSRRQNRRTLHGGSITVLSGETRCGLMKGRDLL